MYSSLSHDEFLGKYYDKAWKIAEVTIASVIKKNGQIHPSIDIDSVKAEGVMAGLERTYENFDVHHKSGDKVDPLLITIVRNCVLNELGKATTAAKRAHLATPTKRGAKDDRKYHNLIKGVPQSQSGRPVEPHDYIESLGWQERKEDVLDLLCKYMKRLPVNDQVILSYWAKDESTYVELALEELGLEQTPINANWVYGRKNKALKALRKMMGGERPDYRDITLTSAQAGINGTVYSNRNDLRRHQYAAKANVTRNINYRETASGLVEKM